MAKTYVVYSDYGWGEKSTPHYVGESIEDALISSLGHHNTVVEIWEDGKFIDTLNGGLKDANR